MPAPVIEFRDETDTLVTAFHDFGVVVPGTPTATVVRNIWNGFGLTGGSAVDTAQNVLVTVSARITATGGQWLGDNIGLLEALALQVQFPGIPELAGFTGAGTGVEFSLPDLPTDTKHEMNVRAVIPAGAVEVGVDFKIAVDFQRTVALPGGIYANTPGILRGTGRSVGLAVLSRDSAFSVSGTDATSTVRWPTYAWYSLGVPYQELGGNAISGDEVLSNLDKSLVALAAGETYGYKTILEDTGRLVLKADKVTGTASFPDDFEPTPAGAILLGQGVRFADADTLAPTHTELVDATPRFFDVTTSGLNYTVAAVGVAAIVHGRLNVNKTSNTGTFPGDGTHTVWILPDGSVDDTPDGLTPQAGASRLVEIVITGSVETARTDLRLWEQGQDISFEFHDASNDDVLSWLNVTSHSLWIRPDQVAVLMSSPPTGFSPTPTSGSIAFDLLIGDGTTETSIFVSQGTDPRFPDFEWDDSVLRPDGTPESPLEIAPGFALVCRVVSDLDQGTPDWAAVNVVADRG